eukprot:gene16382-22583_t
MGVQWKRRRPGLAYAPGQMQQILTHLELTALLRDNSIWLSVDPTTAQYLDMCCTGQKDGGPGTAREVAELLGPLRRASCPLKPPPIQQQQERRRGFYSAHQDVGTSGRDAVAPASDKEAKQETGSTSVKQGSSEHVAGDRPLLAGEDAPPASTSGEEAQRDCASIPQDANTNRGTQDPAGAKEEVSAPAAEVPVGDCTNLGSASTSNAPACATIAKPVSVSKEELQAPIAVRLSLEETFFLKYVLDSLRVFVMPTGSEQRSGTECDGGRGLKLQELDEQGLWEQCCSIRSSFVTNYVGYHHFKAKGWLPRSGLLYGVDYVVYQLHPAAMHSDYGVMLIPLKGPHNPDMAWRDFQITSRLVSQVSKKLILVYIYESSGGASHASAECLKNFSVRNECNQSS